MPITAIYFDIGDVLIKKTASPHDKLSKYLNIDPQTYKQAIIDIDKDPNIANIRPITIEEEKAYFDLFQAKVLNRLGIESSKEKIDFMTNEMMFPERIVNEHSIDILSYLSSKYELAVISDSLMSTYIAFQKFDLPKFFKKIILTRLLGLKKPDPRAFDYALKELNKIPDECAFIDNKAENVLVSQKLGFAKNILYSRPTSLPGIVVISDLSSLKEIL